MSMFQQRHFEALAQAIQDEKASYVIEPGAQIRIDTLQSFAESLAALFRKDNPHFMHDRFLGACQVGANVRAKRHPAPSART